MIGVAKVRNIGIENAQGKYIAFLDSDDFSFCQRVAEQVEYLEGNQKVGLICSDVEIINYGNDRSFSYSLPNERTLRMTMFAYGNNIILSTVMVRKSILIKNKIRFHTSYEPGEDYDFILSVIENYPFHTLQHALGVYRWYLGNTSSAQKENQESKCLHALYKFQMRIFCTKVKEELWLQIYRGQLRHLSFEEIEKVLSYFGEQVEFLRLHDALTDYFLKDLHSKIRYMFIHNHGFSKQILLFNDENISNYLKISTFFKLYCLLTRII